jgi:copper transport protein
MGSVDAFFNTTYGWALVAKIVLLGAIVAVAAGSRRQTIQLERGEPISPGRLRRSMSVEVLVAVFVLGATATLVRAAPPVTESEGPVVRELNLGPMRLQMDIEPATVGPNDMHLYLFDRRTGRQIDRVKEMSLRLTQREKGVGPITLDIPREGPAHYELRNSTLGISGGWEGTVTARVSEFDEFSGRIKFEVRD